VRGVVYVGEGRAEVTDDLAVDVPGPHDVLVRRLGTDASPAHQRWSIEQSMLADADTWIDAISAVAEADLASTLGRVKVPTLVLSPNRSEMVPLKNVFDTISRISDCELIVLPSNANDVVIESPQASARECLSFIRRRGSQSF